MFAATLKKLRESTGLSQPQLSKATGIPQTTLSRWEQGTAEPKLRDLRALAHHFRCSTDYLCGLASLPGDLRPGNFLIDLEVVEERQKSPKSARGKTWAVAIPERFQLITATQYMRLRKELGYED